MQIHRAKWALACLAITTLWTGQLAAQGLTADAPVSALDKIGIDQKLDAQVPLDLPFTDEYGKAVQLRDYFGKKPILLTLVYYECPMLCTEVLNGVLKTFRPMTFEIGKEVDILTISIDPDETSALAMSKKALYTRQYNRPGSENGWHFLTGTEDSIRQLAAAVGFRYEYIPQIDQYSHAAGITLLTPAGKVSRYYFGVEYSSRDLRLGVIEASEEKIGTPVDHVLLYCFNYDPSTGKYSLVIWNLMRAVGFLTVFLLAAYMFFSFRRDRRQAAPSQA
jgi:protein SCO1/2